MALLQPPSLTSHRITHVVFCLFFLSLLLSYNTGLRRAFSGEDLGHACLFLFAGTAAVVSFGLASFTEPGFVLQAYRAELLRSTPLPSEATTGSETEEASVTEEEVDLQPSSPVPPVFSEDGVREQGSSEDRGNKPSDHLLDVEGDLRRLCRVCKVFQPLRSKHCVECRRCVRRQDHHCPYLGQCVGERNHRWYYFFLLTHGGLCIYSAFQFTGAFTHDKDWSKWALKNFPLLFGTLLSVVGSVVFSILLACHTFLIFEGQTTWEYLSGTRITYLKDDIHNPFDEGVVRNLKWFFLSPSPVRPREWEQVYLSFRRRQAARKGALREVVVH